MLLWICPLRLELNEPDPYQTQRAGQHRPAVVRRTPAEISVPDRAAAPLGAMIADRSLSGRILNLLVEMGDRAAPAVPYLAAALEGREDKVVYNAAFALSRVGPAAAGAIEELTAALEHRDKLVRRYCALALGESGAKAADALPELIELQNDGDAHVRGAARRAIAQIRNSS